MVSELRYINYYKINFLSEQYKEGLDTQVGSSETALY